MAAAQAPPPQPRAAAAGHRHGAGARHAGHRAAGEAATLAAARAGPVGPGAGQLLFATSDEPHFYLSQFAATPFTGAGVLYQTAEHYMHAAKARAFGDHAAARRILACASPAGAKDAGRAVQGFSQQRWLRMRQGIVEAGCSLKFAAHPDLAALLAATGDARLVEASSTDAVWACGAGWREAVLAAARGRRAGPGLNLLGRVLERVRAAARQPGWRGRVLAGRADSGDSGGGDGGGGGGGGNDGASGPDPPAPPAPAAAQACS